MIGPEELREVEPVPHGRTARRLEWQHLPPALRRVVEERLGSPVAAAVSQGAGFTPGFASRVTGEDGSRMFVKAANRQAQRAFATSYAEEGRKLGLAPEDLPAPRLLWTHADERWVVLGLEDVDAVAPRRPWRTAELERCLDTLGVVDAVLAGDRGLAGRWRARPITADLPTLLTGWAAVRAAWPRWPHLEEAARLAASFADVPADHLVHADARDDNFLLARDGRTLLCDWNWPALAPRWVDAVDLLATARGDGLDADALIARHPLTADAHPDHVDAWLAALCGFMLEADTRPVPPSSPHLGTHRRWWAAATWSWLAHRRGWTS